MVQQVTLQGPSVASAGNPNFLGSFAGSIRTAGRFLGEVLDGKEEAPTPLRPLVDLLVKEGDRIANKGGSIEPSRVRAATMLKTIQANSPLSPAQLNLAHSIIASTFSPTGGGAGSFATAELAEKKAIEEAEAAINAKILTTVIPSHASMSTEEVRTRVAGTKNLIADTEKNNILAANLASRTDVDIAQRKEDQSNLFRANAHGNTLIYTSHIRGIMDRLGPDSTQDEKDEARRQILKAKGGMLDVLQKSFSQITEETAPLVAYANAAFDLALEGISNEEKARSLTAANKIASEASLHKMIFNNPEATRLHTLLTTLGAYSQSFNFEENSVFGVKINELSTLLGFLPPKKGQEVGEFPLIPIDQLANASNTYITVLKDPTLLSKFKESPELSATFATLGQVLTTQMQVDPTKVPAKVYDNFLRLLATPGKLKDLTSTPEGSTVVDNLATGMRSYTSTLTDSLYRELDSEINSSVPITTGIPSKARTVTRIKAPGSDIQILRVSNAQHILPRKETTTSFPRVGDLVSMEIGPKGNISFSAKPGLEKNPEVTATVIRLTKKYTNRFGMIIRAHAHSNNGNTDYSTAAHQVVVGDRRLRNAFEDKPTQLEVTPKETVKEDTTLDPIKKAIEAKDTAKALEALKELGLNTSSLDINSATEGSIIQMNDGTIAIVKNGKLVEPTSEDLQLG